MIDEKQIEEMAKVIYESKVAIDGSDMAFGLSDKDDHFHRIAKFLYKANCRKLPKNAVVLTKEEAVDMFNRKADGFMTSPIGDLPLNIDGMRKAVDEIARLNRVETELQELNAKYYNEAKDLRRELKQERKKTAREIWKDICTSDFVNINWGNYKTGRISGSIALWAILKILKEQYGVEEKE